MTVIRFIRARPFSIMALCNIVGDLGFLGYAFAADGFVSLPKLAGALCTMFAHILLLAYGDDQARLIAAESGMASRIFLSLRTRAKTLVSFLPAVIRQVVRVKPVGIPFLILSLNGVGLLVDALMHEASIAALSQAALGLLIITGCAAFAAADFVKQQRTANILTKTAPSILVCALPVNIVLALSTLNGFILMSFCAFALSNVAGFFTHIDKEKGQHLHS